MRPLIKELVSLLVEAVLSDDDADILSDKYELEAKDKDPAIARERMRWIARAHGTPLADSIAAVDWRLRDYDFVRTVLGDLDRRVCVRVALECVRPAVELAPATYEDSEEEEWAKIAIEAAESWLRGETSTEECFHAASGAMGMGDEFAAAAGWVAYTASYASSPDEAAAEAISGVQPSRRVFFQAAIDAWHAEHG
jgi:hypothetical protein